MTFNIGSPNVSTLNNIQLNNEVTTSGSKCLAATIGGNCAGCSLNYNFQVVSITGLMQSTTPITLNDIVIPSNITWDSNDQPSFSFQVIAQTNNPNFPVQVKYQTSGCLLDYGDTLNVYPGSIPVLTLNIKIPGMYIPQSNQVLFNLKNSQIASSQLTLPNLNVSFSGLPLFLIPFQSLFKDKISDVINSNLDKIANAIQNPIQNVLSSTDVPIVIYNQCPSWNCDPLLGPTINNDFSNGRQCINKQQITQECKKLWNCNLNPLNKSCTPYYSTTAQPDNFELYSTQDQCNTYCFANNRYSLVNGQCLPDAKGQFTTPDCGGTGTTTGRCILKEIVNACYDSFPDVNNDPSQPPIPMTAAICDTLSIMTGGQTTFVAGQKCGQGICVATQSGGVCTQGGQSCLVCPAEWATSNGCFLYGINYGIPIPQSKCP